MVQVRQAGDNAARASSSDLAAAQALAELRHEDEVDEDDCMESDEEMAEEEEWRGGSRGAGYDRGFRVTAPPLPLWLPGALLLFIHAVMLFCIPHMLLSCAFLHLCDGPDQVLQGDRNHL